MSSETLFPDWDRTALPASSAPVGLEDIERLAPSYQISVLTEPNVYGPSRDRPDPWATWEAALADGQSYLCGSSVSREAFLRLYRRPLLDWMIPAYAWAAEDKWSRCLPGRRHFSWHVYQRGEYVSFKLPFHDSGGEKEYISRDGMSRLKVNDD